MIKSIVSFVRKCILLPKALWMRLQFQRVQGARLVPDKSYFVAPNGQVMRKYPKLHMTKKRRLAQRQPAKLRKFIDDSQAALVYARDTITKQQKLMIDLREKFREGKYGYAEVMKILREATA